MPIMAESVTSLRMGVRGLVRRPGFALLVVLTMALGIGTTTAIFGVLDRIVLRPLPYRGGDRMVYLALKHLENGWQVAPSQAHVERWRAGAATLERIEVYTDASLTRTGEGMAENLPTVGFSSGMPGMLGVVPLVGRMLGPVDAEAGAPPVVMLAEAYWRRAFGADREVVGRAMRLNDTLFTIAGVWPATARLDYRGAPSLYRVLPAGKEVVRGDFALVLARARQGASAEEIERELRSLAVGEGAESEGFVAAVNAPYGFVRDGYIRGLWAAFVGGIVLLVVALANAVNLMIGRASSREGELGLRVALGAAPSRVMVLLLGESVVLCVAGLAIALAVASGLGRALEVFRPAGFAPGGTGLDERAYAVALSLTVVGILACALFPLVALRRLDVRQLLDRGVGPRGGRSGITRPVLLGIQASLAVVLACTASLLTRSFLELDRVDTGTDIEHLVTVAVNPPTRRYPTPERKLEFQQRVRDELGALPGVSGVTIQSAPLFRFGIQAGVPFLDGDSPPDDSGRGFSALSGAEPDYFRVMGIPLRAGRVFSTADLATPVVIVNDAFQRRHGEVLGRYLRMDRDDTNRRLIVGVVGDVKSNGLTSDPERVQIYTPSVMRAGYTSFVLRVSGSPDAALAAARAAVSRLDPELPVSYAITGVAMLREQTAESRFLAVLLAGFAAFGLLFALGGIFGAMSLDVIRRRRELGVRLAVGATGRDVVVNVIWRGMRPVFAGSVAGLAIALWGGFMVESLLFRIPARDPASALVAVGLLALAAAAGAAVPAWRASRVDPRLSLQAE